MDYSILISRRHPKISEKEEIWKLIYDSYLGGQAYKEGNYLFKHPKESTRSYEERSKRATYLNQISPIVNLLSGFLFYPPPIRRNTDLVSYLFQQRGAILPMDMFIKNVAAHSLLFTCAVLVDSPEFNEEEVQTERQRRDYGLYPYCTMYLPFYIRDFNIDQYGELNWILLDDSYTDNTDPFVEAESITRYTLWTKTYVQRFIIDSSNKEGVVAEEPRYHNIGKVPCRLVNWQDIDRDNIAESVMEDPALLSRSIYNTKSLLDEMMYIGTLRVLFYPSRDGELPAELQIGGIGSLSAIPFDGSVGQPFFDNARLDNVESYIKVIEMDIAEILRKIGMDTDQAKEFVQSGKAKKLDLLKIKTLLLNGAMSMQSLEKWICEMALAWEKKNLPFGLEIVYNTDYEEADIENKLNSLSRFLFWPFEKIRKAAYKVILQKGMGEELGQYEMEELLKEIEQGELKKESLDLDKFLVEEREFRRSKNTPSEEQINGTGEQNVS